MVCAAPSLNQQAANSYCPTEASLPTLEEHAQNGSPVARIFARVPRTFGGPATGPFAFLFVIPRVLLIAASRHSCRVQRLRSYRNCFAV